MYKPETLISAALRRTRKIIQIQKLRKEQIFFQEIKFNGSPEHFLTRCDDVDVRKKYTPICELLASNFYTLNLPYQKAFLLQGTDQHFQPLFKNTEFVQGLRCEDEVFSWNMKELRDLYHFYKELA